MLKLIYYSFVCVAIFAEFVTIYQVLHTYKGNKGAYKALIAAEYAGVKIEEASNFQMGVTNKTPEFLKMNPIGKVCLNLFMIS